MGIVTETVPAATGVGSPFDFDASAFLQGRTPGQPIALEPLGSNDLLDQAAQVTEQFLSGELDPSVAEQIRINTSEAAIAGGVSGQIGRRLVAKDIGRTVVDLQQVGLQATPQITELQTRRELANREFELSEAQFNQTIKQWEDQFAVTLNSADLNSAQVAMAAIDLQSRNRQFRIDQENRLILQNSVNEIAGLQGNLDSMRNLFDNFNRQLQSFVNAFS